MPDKLYKCPICGKSTEVQYKPFCSKRCADIDLGKWLGESYAIPVEEFELPEDSGIESDSNE